MSSPCQALKAQREVGAGRQQHLLTHVLLDPDKAVLVVETLCLPHEIFHLPRGHSQSASCGSPYNGARHVCIIILRLVYKDRDVAAAGLSESSCRNKLAQDTL